MYCGLFANLMERSLFDTIIYIEENMEGLEELKFSQQLNQSLQNSRLLQQNIDQVTLHCRRDHLSPTKYEHTSHSSYQASFSPSKAKNYNQPEIQKGLSRFRKYQNSTTILPSLPKVSEGSHYQNAYNAHSVEKEPRGHEKASYFLKCNWALDPASNYQKSYQSRQGSMWNKDNKDRPSHNQLEVFKLKEKPNRSSNYRSDFKVFTIKKEAQMALGSKDHMTGLNKENMNEELNISEYQRRYDSVMERTKGKDTLSIYGKNKVVARGKKE